MDNRRKHKQHSANYKKLQNNFQRTNTTSQRKKGKRAVWGNNINKIDMMILMQIEKSEQQQEGIARKCLEN